jgi:hypothetical protein
VTFIDNPLISGNRQLLSRDGHSAGLVVATSCPSRRSRPRSTTFVR